MVSTTEEIFKTLAYADIFDYPLTKKEINKWLVKGDRFGTSASTLASPTGVGPSSEPSLFNKTKSYYYLSNRSHLVKLRLKRQRFSQLKLIKAKKVAKILSFMPSIRLIAVTGALAMNNADQNDDIDLMIITKTNRLWLARPILILILEFLRLRRRPTDQGDQGQSLTGNPTECRVGTAKPEGLSLVDSDKICLNLFIDESSLAISASRRNLYTAHEVCQIKPLINKNQTYENFLSQNSWVKNYLPNAIKVAKRSVLEGLENVSSKPLALQNHHLRGEVVPAVHLGGVILKIINLLAFKLQYAYMKSKITNEKVNLHSAFFHPRPTGKIVLKEYKKRLRRRTVLNGQKTILVTGCFDVLHSEHKKFIKAAKNLGGQLLIGLETDSRIKKLKGENRPINTLDTRINNLKKWGIADQIFALPKKFSSPADHLALLQSIKPDILAVSAHTPNLPAKQKLMKIIGASVKVVLPHNPKISSTKIIRGS